MENTMVSALKALVDHVRLQAAAQPELASAANTSTGTMTTFATLRDSAEEAKNSLRCKH